MVGNLRTSDIGQKGKIGALIHYLEGFPTCEIDAGCSFWHTPAVSRGVFLFISLFILRWIYLFIFGCTGCLLCGLSLVVASGGCSSLLHAGFSWQWFSCCRAQALGARISVAVARGLRSAGSGAMAHGPSCSAACRLFLDQGSTLSPLHWQADAQPLDHQGSRPAVSRVFSLLSVAVTSVAASPTSVSVPFYPLVFPWVHLCVWPVGYFGVTRASIM